MRENVARADAVLVARSGRARGRRKLASTTAFDADVPIERSRSDPFELDAVLVQLVAEKHLVRERRVGKVPGVRVNLVLVTHGREETPGLDGESIRQGKGLDVSLLHSDAVFGRYRCDQRPAEVMIDVCRNGELRL